MLDRNSVGTQMRAVTVVAEAGSLRLFAKATGQTDPVYFDEQAARAAGYRSIVGPPTFAHALYAMGNDCSFELFERMGIDLADTLHGEQSFEYGALICAGDTIRFHGRVTDVYAKKAGTLQFLVMEVRGHNQLDEAVASMRTTTIVVSR